MALLLIFFGSIGLIFFILWLVELIRETHKTSVKIEERVANIELLLEKLNNNK
ncbi:hypothetical protein [Alkaliphilus peptidifermentans]|uniref:Uncharacterized protein n=1 Tax=Alkaliphilus peptidifermentans DSM 18978 TaxID=1120976 RepID=A0A1G5C1W5_9FIRM|nr:hypothetical protein [Alkaliphilus peptidifermentans]SCX96378.1 hypothetical protein SAMN03080606_00593 [Alkaliphilus peptidifermentans DSM 18978]